MKYIKLDDLQSYCDNQKDHSITPNEFQRMNHYEFGWHTGTPQEEGWYVLAYKHLDGYRYTTDYFVKGYWAFMPIAVFDDMVAWQKIEPFLEAST